jgi:hypothetical protein
MFCLIVSASDAVVTYMGVGEIDDLSGIGRVSYHFLVSTQDGVKHHLARSDIGFCAYKFSFERCAISEH